MMMHAADYNELANAIYYAGENRCVEVGIDGGGIEMEFNLEVDYKRDDDYESGTGTFSLESFTFEVIRYEAWNEDGDCIVLNIDEERLNRKVEALCD